MSPSRSGHNLDHQFGSTSPFSLSLPLYFCFARVPPYSLNVPLNFYETLSLDSSLATNKSAPTEATSPSLVSRHAKEAQPSGSSSSTKGNGHGNGNRRHQQQPPLFIILRPHTNRHDSSEQHTHTHTVSSDLLMRPTSSNESNGRRSCLISSLTFTITFTCTSIFTSTSTSTSSHSNLSPPPVCW